MLVKDGEAAEAGWQGRGCIVGTDDAYLGVSPRPRFFRIAGLASSVASI